MKLHPRVTRSLVELVKRFEGLRRNSARLADGGWTIGYGHIRSARSGAVVSPEDAEALLYYDLSEVAEKVDAWTFTPLNQNQFEALTAFAFNIGLTGFRSSSVLKLINEGQILGAAIALERWRKANLGGETQVVDALVRRRAAEKAHFLTPPEGFRPSPTPVLRPLFDPPPSFHGLSGKGEPEGAKTLGDAATISGAPPDGAAMSPPGDILAGASASSTKAGAEDKLFGCRPAPLTPLADPGAPSPFEAPPPPIERARPHDAPFPSSTAQAHEREASASADHEDADAASGVVGPAQATSGIKRDHAFLIAAIGCVGVACLAAGVFSIFFSRANPLNLLVGLVGILLATPAGAYFANRFLNGRNLGVAH